jgi:ABC-type spermidine/putrescine transport system permease subunit I
VGETQRIGFGSALGAVLLVISLVPISIFLWQAFRKEEQES